MAVDEICGNPPHRPGLAIPKPRAGRASGGGAPGRIPTKIETLPYTAASSPAPSLRLRDEAPEGGLGQRYEHGIVAGDRAPPEPVPLHGGAIR